MADDVVVMLDRWMAALHEAHPDYAGLQRARDEIVALREVARRVPMLATLGDIAADGLMKARDEALEEAAHECDEEAKGSGGEVAFRDGCETCAAAIRLLKDEGRDPS